MAKEKKTIVLKSKRLLISPMSDEEIVKLIEEEASEELKQAYGEMLEGCGRDPDNRIWYAPWKMVLKQDGTMIGDVDFKGPAQNHAVEIGYGIRKEYEGNGYTTEAVRVLVEWAFSQKDVIFVEAETAPDNKASQRILEKLKFVPDGNGEEGPRFVLESPLPNWMSIYMLFGLSIGMSLGTASGHSGIGLSLGICFGMCIGAALDALYKKQRNQIKEERAEHKKKKTE